MRNCIYFLIISLFTLGGCNQSLESDQKSIASDKRIRVILGHGGSNQIQRYKGSYNDVVNGGSVKLSYGFQGAALQTVDMMYNGSDWTADLTLNVGTFDFRASAYNSAGVMIFDAATTKTYSITPQTSNLILGIQLNPVMEDTGDTPTPVITQITKPSGYIPGGRLNLEFTVKGGLSDLLKFKINVQDNASNSVGTDEFYSTQLSNVSSSGTSKLYNGVIGVPIPVEVTGQVLVEFSVYSEALQRTTNAQFVVDGASEEVTAAGTIVFMPQAEFSMGVREDTAANTIVWIFDLIGSASFTDNISFAYDNPSIASNFILSQDPIDQMRPGRRSGELYRELMEDGTMTITFTSTDGEFTNSYNFEVPAEVLTQFNTVNYVDGYRAPEVKNISLSADTVALGETITVNIEASDGLFGYSWVDVNAKTFSNNHTDPYDWTISSVSGGDHSFPNNEDSFTPQLNIREWSVPGEWIIEYFYITDQYGYSSYHYRPGVSETHYIREYREYEYDNSWDVASEKSNLPILRFNVTGDYNPDLSEPEIVSISLSPSTIALGESLTVNIEASDDVSGVCSVSVNARKHSDNYSNPYYYNYDYAWGNAWNENCWGDGINFPDNDTITLTPQLEIRRWSMSGEWIIESLYLSDRAGRSGNYRYNSDISQTHYVRSYNQYDNSTGSWHWVEEESSLPLVTFTVTGDSTPDIKSPEITSISLDSDTVSLGESLTVNIAGSDDVSGICSIHVNARSYSDDYSDPYYYDYDYAWGYAWNEHCSGDGIDFPDNGTIILAPELWFENKRLGEWILENLQINDRAGRWSNYYYQPDTSTTHYVRSYNQYDNSTGGWHWVEEESNLSLVNFTVMGNLIPEPEPVDEELEPVEEEIEDVIPPSASNVRSHLLRH